MADKPVVAVRGEVVWEIPPEIARFSVAVTARDPDRQATLARLTLRVVSVGAILDEYGYSVERRETGSVHVSPDRRRSGERVSGYQGSVSTTVTVADFTVLGELMMRLADQDQTTVYGPWWDLRPGSSAHRDARRAAIADAFGRAQEYAEAVGARLERLLEIADVGLSPQPVTTARAMTGRPAAMLAAAGEPTPRLDLDPQVQTVYAQVETRFTISEPTLLAQPPG